MRGAGGTDGGLMPFLIGFVMMCSGFYMLLNAIVVRTHFNLGHSLYSLGGFGVTSGMIMIPFIFGIGIMFYNSKNYIGWMLAGGSIVAFIFGVISNINFSMRHMTAFDLIVIFVLAFGGLGLFLRSLYPRKNS